MEAAMIRMSLVASLIAVASPGASAQARDCGAGGSGCQHPLERKYYDIAVRTWDGPTALWRAFAARCATDKALQALCERNPREAGRRMDLTE
jgi:hypothetical protein